MGMPTVPGLRGASEGCGQPGGSAGVSAWGGREAGAPEDHSDWAAEAGVWVQSHLIAERCVRAGRSEPRCAESTRTPVGLIPGLRPRAG